MQGTEATDLIAALEAERLRRRLDHKQFSTLLGIHASGWHRVRTGERLPSLDNLTRILQKLPTLHQKVCSYMIERDISGDGENNPSKTANKTSPDHLGHGKGRNTPQKPSHIDDRRQF